MLTTYRHSIWHVLFMSNIVPVFLGVVLFEPLSAHAALGPNLIVNPGLETANSSGGPAGWSRGRWGTNSAVFTYPVPGFSSARAARVSLTAYTSGDAKWYFTDVPVQAGSAYQFSDFSRSNLKSHITVRYRYTNGSYQYVDIGTMPASSGWQQFTGKFSVPSGVAALTMFHLIKNVGWLDTDSYSLRKMDSNPLRFTQGIISLNFDDGLLSTYQNALPILNRAGLRSTQFIVTGRMRDSFASYVKVNQVLAMQSQGHEIGAHTRTHSDLTVLSADILQGEVAGSRQDLLDIGATPINFFAYPFGSYNDTVKQSVQSAGFSAARSSDGGYNLKTQDVFILNRQGIRVYTTVDQAKGYIDTALRDKSWLILVFHAVDYSGTEYSATPETLQRIVDYLKLKNAKVVTMGEGLQLMRQ